LPSERLADREKEREVVEGVLLGRGPAADGHEGLAEEAMAHVQAHRTNRRAQADARAEGELEVLRGEGEGGGLRHVARVEEEGARPGLREVPAQLAGGEEAGVSAERDEAAPAVLVDGAEGREAIGADATEAVGAAAEE